MRVWSVGEVLWDIFPDMERFGGAALNFCVNLHRLGDDATLISCVGTDQRGHLALEKMSALGLTTDYVCKVSNLPTGTAIVSTGTDGEPNYIIPRPAAFDSLSISDAAIHEAQSIGVDWLYFGSLLHSMPLMERFTIDLVKKLPFTRCFYDMNLRKGHWNLSLVERLSTLASALKLNEAEAETLFALSQTHLGKFSLEEFCKMWADKYAIDLICVTLGPAGCLVYDHGVFYRSYGYAVNVCDTVGSGDAFAAAFLHGYHRGWPIMETARFANALGALVAGRAGATPEWSIAECLALMQTKSCVH